jgi:hypothetical protein
LGQLSLPRIGQSQIGLELAQELRHRSELSQSHLTTGRYEHRIPVVAKRAVLRSAAVGIRARGGGVEGDGAAAGRLPAPFLQREGVVLRVVDRGALLLLQSNKRHFSTGWGTVARATNTGLQDYFSFLLFLVSLLNNCGHCGTLFTSEFSTEL